MRRLASYYLRGERRDHTLQPTALVHEAFLRLVDQANIEYQSRAHFMRVAAQTMRRILIDYARGRQRKKRGGGEETLFPGEELVVSEDRVGQLLVIDQVLERLAKFDRRQAQVVELRFFGGLTVEETSEVLGISVKTVKRDWALAKAWLYGQLRKPGGDDCRDLAKN
jgi:RNA polymerase sigma factor (TIGR02999 family)